MEAQIAKLIEDEVERRLQEKLTKVLEHISKTYDVSMKQLLKDTSTLKVTDNTCMGLTSKKQRCRLKQHEHGFCRIHQNQRPIQRPMQHTSSVSDMSSVKSQHNHPGSILWQDGCPGCRKKSPRPLMIEI
jgi:hypothetical protein